MVRITPSELNFLTGIQLLLPPSHQPGHDVCLKACMVLASVYALPLLRL